MSLGTGAERAATEDGAIVGSLLFCRRQAVACDRTSKSGSHTRWVKQTATQNVILQRKSVLSIKSASPASHRLRHP